MEKLTCEKTRAAYLLSDEIFGAFRGAQLANHLLNSAMDFRLDDEEIDDTDQYVLRATFKELIWRMDILSHYLSEVTSDLYLRGSTRPAKLLSRPRPRKPVPSPTLKSLHG